MPRGRSTSPVNPMPHPCDSRLALLSTAVNNVKFKITPNALFIEVCKRPVCTMLAAHRVPPAKTLPYRAHNAYHTAREQRPLTFWLPCKLSRNPSTPAWRPAWRLGCRRRRCRCPAPARAAPPPAPRAQPAPCTRPARVRSEVQALQRSSDIRRVFVTSSACSARYLHGPGSCRSSKTGAAKEPRDTAGPHTLRALCQLHGNAPRSRASFWGRC